MLVKICALEDCDEIDENTFVVKKEICGALYVTVFKAKTKPKLYAGIASNAVEIKRLYANTCGL